MSYRVVIGGNNVDLFPEQEINISLDYYDNEDPSRIKIPFSFEDKFPYTSHNKTYCNTTHLMRLTLE